MAKWNWTKANQTKYKAIRTEVDGISFDSKKEAGYYTRLKLLQTAGEVSFFLRQVPFDLPGKIKYRCDFQVFYSDGRIEFVDVKGYMTKLSQNKIKQTESLYPVKIKVV